MGRRSGLLGALSSMAKAADKQARAAQRHEIFLANAHLRTVREEARDERERKREEARLERERTRDAIERGKAEKLAYLSEMNDKATDQTEDIQTFLEEIDTILAYTLEVDDFFDMGELRQVVNHPKFKSKYQKAEPRPAKLEPAQEPLLSLPKEPGFWSRLFGGTKVFKSEVARLQDLHEAAVKQWRAEIAELPGLEAENLKAWEQREREREDRLAADRKEYDCECQQREIECQAANAEIDETIGKLRIGRADIVERYFTIVLDRSKYPEGLKPISRISFNEMTRELHVDLTAATPEIIPNVAEYRYQKAKDQIVSKSLPQKEIKSRYENFIASIALRTVHEICEADREGIIGHICLSVGVDHINEGTGKNARTILIEVAIGKEDFLSIDLGNVDPLQTLNHFNASVSKNIFGLKALPRGIGVRNLS